MLKWFIIFLNCCLRVKEMVQQVEVLSVSPENLRSNSEDHITEGEC